jgi:hypothetical protein
MKGIIGIFVGFCSYGSVRNCFEEEEGGLFVLYLKCKEKKKREL